MLQTNVVPQRDSQSRCQNPRVFWSAATHGTLELSTISFPEPTCLLQLLFKFDTVLSKPNFDFLGFSSAYYIPLCNKSCKPRHACAVEPELLKSWVLEINYCRASQRSNDWARAQARARFTHFRSFRSLSRHSSPRY